MGNANSIRTIIKVVKKYRILQAVQKFNVSIWLDVFKIIIKYCD